MLDMSGQFSNIFGNFPVRTACQVNLSPVWSLQSVNFSGTWYVQGTVYFFSFNLWMIYVFEYITYCPKLKSYQRISKSPFSRGACQTTAVLSCMCAFCCIPWLYSRVACVPFTMSRSTLPRCSVSSHWICLGCFISVCTNSLFLRHMFYSKLSQMWPTLECVMIPSSYILIFWESYRTVENIKEFH